MKVAVDHERCQGHGRCYELAPGVFDADDDGYVVLLPPDGDVPADLEGQARSVVGNCPERAHDPRAVTDRQPEGARTGHTVYEDQPDHVLARMRMWEVDDPEAGSSLEVEAHESVCNPHGSPHAAVMAGLIDCAAAGVAVRVTGTEALAGADMQVRFLSPVRVGPARLACARVLKAGRRSVVVHVDVVDIGADRRLVATATMSFTRLDG